MDLNEIKEIVEREGGKIIVVENNRPVLVILSYGDFKRRSQELGNDLGKTPKSEQESTPAPEKQEPLENTEDLTIDDLPL